MHLPTHALVSWMVAEVRPLTRRERACVLAAGLAPDLDALSLAFGVEAYQRWHHPLLHNGLAALAGSLLLALVARAGPAVDPGAPRVPHLGYLGLLVASFHLHLLCDLVGSGGPDGSNWGIPYLSPFSPREFAWAGQWALASWQNVSLTVLLLAASVVLSKRRGRTLVEALSLRADAAVVEVIRRRWP